MTILLAGALASTGLGPATAAQTTDSVQQETPFTAAVAGGTINGDAFLSRSLRCLVIGPMEMTIVPNGTTGRLLATYAFSHPCASHAGECEQTSGSESRIGFACTAGQRLTVQVESLTWTGAAVGTAELSVSIRDSLPFTNGDIEGDLLATVARDDPGLEGLSGSTGPLPSPLK